MTEPAYFSIGVRKTGGWDPLARWEAVILYQGEKHRYVGHYATRWGAIAAARNYYKTRIDPDPPVYEEVAVIPPGGSETSAPAPGQEAH